VKEREIVPQGIREGDLEFGRWLHEARRRKAMTQVPPLPLPDPGLVFADGTVLPGQEALEAWHRAYLEHRRRDRAERIRYAAVCAAIRAQYGPPSGTPRGITFPAPAWAQDTFDGTVLPGDDEDDHRDRGVDLLPCERDN